MINADEDEVNVDGEFEESEGNGRNTSEFKDP